MFHIYTKEVHATYETIEIFFDPQTRMSIEMTTSIRLVFENA
jgi:hypothetical protein